MKRLMMLMMVLMLGPGCGSGVLSSVGGALVGLASGAGVEYAEDKFAAKVIWASKRDEVVGAVRLGMLTYAQSRLMAGDFRCWRQLMNDVLEFDDQHKPLFLIEKAIKKRAAPAEGAAVPRLDCLPPARAAPTPSAGEAPGG